MAEQIMATEEVRDELALDGPDTVRNLAGRLEVSESTVRRSLGLLIARGWVERGPGRGIYQISEVGLRASEENVSL